MNINRLYRVSGNLDQIIAKGLQNDHTWTPHPRQANRVSTELEYDKAVELYNQMKSLDMVAHKNWF
jgi:hypothetical protein